MTPKSESKPGGMGVFKYELLLLLISMIWGSAFVAQQIGMEQGLGPMTFGGLRFALGCLSLIPLIIWRKRNLPAADREAKLPYKACLGAGLLLFAAAALQQIGLQYTSSANSGFITGFYILFAAIAGYLVLHQTLTGRAIIGCLLILTGVLLVQLVPMMRRRKKASRAAHPSSVRVSDHRECGPQATGAAESVEDDAGQRAASGDQQGRLGRDRDQAGRRAGVI